MNLLIIGGGGREHALAWKLSRSPKVGKIFCAPGNAGTARLGCENVPLAITDADGLLALAQSRHIDLTVVGPDDALAAGIVDRFQAAGLRIFGPTREAARLEWSKIFTKDFLQRHRIPTAAAGRFERSADAHAFCEKQKYPLVIKADGLATGKGVIIAETPSQAAAAIDDMMTRARFGEAGRRILIEEFMRGPECSLHAFIDGETYRLLPPAQDYKRIGEGNSGENTGGMGTVSPPVTPLSAETLRRIDGEIMRPLMAGLRADGLRFQGLLFPGLMLTADGPKVLEFNARFGDPETQVLLPRLKSDLLPALEAVVDSRLGEISLDWDPRPAVCVILASGGYPGAYETGKPISGLDAIPSDSADTFVFHAGTKPGADGQTVTSGGRVLGVTALGETIADARARAYEAAALIGFEGQRFRRDIAAESHLG
jgi:phosphoribosylamine--glycine ligase